MDTDRFRHDRSAYERPGLTYRCGRAATWGQPCGKGPSVDGACGGVSQCAPFFNGARWECRRPASQGGACADGPLPDGTCCNRQPPCEPRRTLRALRGRLTIVAAMLMVVLIAATFSMRGDGAVHVSSIDPGQLSGLHARFTQEQGCTGCHSAHGSGPIGWIKAAFSSVDMTGQCLTCHTFGGPERAPHNFPAGAVQLAKVTPEASKAAGAIAETACSSCHTEHRGTDANISAFSDTQCSTCHQKKFSHFGGGHPAFGDRFPYEKRTAINFDHTEHLAKHFPANQAQAPQGGCIGCHEVVGATSYVPVRGYADTCGGCHNSQIQSKDLVAFTMPELSPAQFVTIDQDAIGKSCGPRSEDSEANFKDAIEAAKKAVEAKDQGDFQSVSDKKMVSFQKLLIGADDDAVVDLEADDAAVKGLVALVAAMAKDGAVALGAGIDAKLGAGKAAPMLAGLSPELVKRAACAWAGNEEYAGGKPVGSGWYVDGLSLRYKASTDADPVIKAWLTAATDPALGKAEKSEQVRLSDLRAELLDPKSGPGVCASCHAVTDKSATGAEVKKLAAGNMATELAISWKFDTGRARHYVRFSHKPHINLLGPGRNCESCHVMNPQAAYAEAFTQLNPLHYDSNFKPVKMEQCTACHGAGQVRNDCLTCHEYHREPGFRKLMMTETGKEG